MARKKRSVERTRQLYQQRDNSGQFVGRFVFAALGAALTYWLTTTVFTVLAPGLSQLPALFRTYQYVPLALGIAAALSSGWVKERTRGARSETFYAVLLAALMAGLSAAVIFLAARLQV